MNRSFVNCTFQSSSETTLDKNISAFLEYVHFHIVVDYFFHLLSGRERERMPQLNVSLLFVACGLYVCQAFSPSFSPSNNGRRYSSRVILNAKEDLDPVEKIFKFLFGEKEEKPLGFTRYNQTTSPENFPAVIDRYDRPKSVLTCFFHWIPSCIFVIAPCMSLSPLHGNISRELLVSFNHAEKSMYLYIYIFKVRCPCVKRQ